MLPEELKLNSGLPNTWLWASWIRSDTVRKCTFITDTSFDSRLRSTISAAWAVFARKVGSTLIPINKEASMQLQYAFVLKQLLPMALQHPDERAEIELEPGVNMGTGSNNIDILVHGASSSGETKIAIEMKCYRKIAASGRTRGAHDIFMKDVYEDLHVLEQYVAQGVASRGVALVMNDLERFVNPKAKDGKCWTYDTSHGHTFQGGISLCQLEEGCKHPARAVLHLQLGKVWSVLVL
jgi:hypothetical protein